MGGGNVRVDATQLRPPDRLFPVAARRGGRDRAADLDISRPRIAPTSLGSGLPGVAPRTLKVRFSIAASVKPGPDYLMLSPFCASASERHTGLLLLFEVGAKPPHDGMRRMGRYNLSGALAAGQRQDRRTLRTHPIRRPREDIFLPEQNALSPCRSPSPRFRQP